MLRSLGVNWVVLFIWIRTPWSWSRMALPYTSIRRLLLAPSWNSGNNWVICTSTSSRLALACSQKITGSKSNKIASHSVQELYKSPCLFKSCHKANLYSKMLPFEGKATKSHYEIIDIHSEKTVFLQSTTCLLIIILTHFSFKSIDTGS